MPQTTQFANAFSDALRSAAFTHTGTAWQSRVTPAPEREDPTALPTAVALALRFAGRIEGELFLCPDEQASRHTFLAVQEEGPDAFPAAWLSLLEKSTREIAQGLAADFGEVQLEHCRLVPPPADAASLADVVLHTGETAQGSILLLGDSRLRASLQASGRLATMQTGGLATASAFQTPPLERVIDVPLAVTLRFGQRQLTLRELLELNTGSLVELDRQVEEPVDLMLGERVIAKGEVVIVDGNYGMRVTEVIENGAGRLTPDTWTRGAYTLHGTAQGRAQGHAV